MKEVVRRKLDLDPGTVIRLAQLRAGKPIDLEDGANIPCKLLDRC